MSREALIAVIVWTFLIEYHLKLSPVRELSFSRFLTIIKINVKMMLNSSILIKVNIWDLKRAFDQLK